MGAKQGLIIVFLFCRVLSFGSWGASNGTGMLHVINFCDSNAVSVIGDSVSYYLDSDNLNIDQISAKLRHGRFTETKHHEHSFGLTTDAVWVAFSVKNNTKARIFLEFDNEVTDRIEMWCIDSNQTATSHILTGDTTNYYNRPIEDRNFIFPLLHDDCAVRVLMRISGNNPLSIPLYVGTFKQLKRRAAFEGLYLFGYFGLLVSIWIGLLSLYIIYRKRYYIYYFVYISSKTWFLFSIKGYIFAYFLQYQPRESNLLTNFSLTACVFSGTFFAMKFLYHNSEISRRLKQLMYLVPALCVLATILQIGGYIKTSIYLTSFSIFYAVAISVVMGLQSKQRLNFFMRCFRVAVVLLLSISMFQVACVLGWKENIVWNNDIVILLAAAEMLCVLFILLYKIYLSRKDLIETLTKQNHEVITDHWKIVANLRKLQVDRENLNIDLDAVLTELDLAENKRGLIRTELSAAKFEKEHLRQELNRILEEHEIIRTEYNYSKIKHENILTELDKAIEDRDITREQLTIAIKERDQVLSEAEDAWKEVNKADVKLGRMFGKLVDIEDLLKLSEYELEATKKSKNEISDLNLKLAVQLDKVSALKKNIQSSIEGAFKIQQAILPSQQKLDEGLGSNTIFYKPKDVVSGDFYWYETVGDISVLCVVDCTGHGVPGAFLSILAYSALNSIVINSGVTDPAQILLDLDISIKNSLNSDINREPMEQGMEIAVLTIDRSLGILQYAGAKRPLHYYHKNKNEIAVYNPSKVSIGINVNINRDFKNECIKLEAGDRAYLFTDGYIDQFGTPSAETFKTKRFKELLSEMKNLPINSQVPMLEAKYEEWRTMDGSDNEQVDDILIVVIEFDSSHNKYNTQFNPNLHFLVNLKDPFSCY
ncbi:MAG: 7TM-DISM domain-containing protein [Bacteroidota bacterium]